MELAPEITSVNTSLRNIHRSSTITERCPKNVINLAGGGGQHDEAVEAERHAGCRRPVRESREKVLVEWIAPRRKRAASLHFGDKAFALFHRIGEFAKPRAGQMANDSLTHSHANP